MTCTANMKAADPACIAGRLERLPATRGFWRRITFLSLGGFFEFYDLFLAAYVAPGLVKSGIYTATTSDFFGNTGIAGFVASFFLGLFFGTALFGYVADRFGRRTIFTVSLLWYAAASVIMAFQQDAFSLNLWRFICGIGIIDVAAMFGVGAIRREKRIDLVIMLKQWNPDDDVDRLGLEQETTDLLGQPIPRMTIPVRPGRDLANLIEIAALQTKLKQSGHNAAEAFTARLAAAMVKPL